MRVEIIDDTHQCFNGKNYHLHKSGYFISQYTRIHRAVWEFHNGAIPKGYEIHHADNDKSNNQIENLVCVTRAEHTKLHYPPKTFICQVCGKSFVSKGNPKRCPDCRAELKRQREEKRSVKKVKPFKPRKFMTQSKCPLDATSRCPKPIAEKICPVCGKPFKGRHSWQKTCSLACGVRLRLLT